MKMKMTTRLLIPQVSAAHLVQDVTQSSRYLYRYNCIVLRLRYSSCQRFPRILIYLQWVEICDKGGDFICHLPTLSISHLMPQYELVKSSWFCWIIDGKQVQENNCTCFVFGMPSSVAKDIHPHTCIFTYLHVSHCAVVRTWMPLHYVPWSSRYFVVTDDGERSDGLEDQPTTTSQQPVSTFDWVSIALTSLVTSNI